MTAPCLNCIHESVCRDVTTVQKVVDHINELLDTTQIQFGNKTCLAKDIPILDLGSSTIKCKNFRIEASYQMAAQMAQCHNNVYSRPCY